MTSPPRIALAVFALAASAPGLPANDPVAAKELARAVFERRHDDPKTLPAQRRDALRRACDERVGQFRQGRGTLTFLFADEDRLAQAMLALARTDAERLAVRRAHWVVLWFIHESQRDLYEAGRVSIHEMAQAKYRLGMAQNQLAESGPASSATGTRVAVPTAGSVLLEAWEDAERNPVASRDLARAMYEACHSSRQEAAGEALRGATIEFAAGELEFLAGRGTFEFRTYGSQRVLDAAAHAFAAGENRLAYLEACWVIARRNEEINRQRFQAGRLPEWDAASSRWFRLDLEVPLAAALEKHGGEETIPPPLVWPTVVLESRYWRFAADGNPAAFRYEFENREAAGRELFAARSRDPGERLVSRAEAARLVCEERMKELEKGQGTLVFLLESSQRLLDAELPLAKSRVERRQAVERHWRRIFDVETANRDWLRDGRVPAHDYWNSVERRLEAQMELERQTTGGVSP